MNICVLQGGRQAVLHWDTAVYAKEDSSFEEVFSFECWHYCSKGLEDALDGFKYEKQLCCTLKEKEVKRTIL